MSMTTGETHEVVKTLRGETLSGKYSPPITIRCHTDVHLWWCCCAM